MTTSNASARTEAPKAAARAKRSEERAKRAAEEKAQSAQLYVVNSLLNLLTDWTWVNRRIERIDIIGDATVQHSVSIDFTLPETAELPSPFPIPLGFQKKSILRHFSLRDEDDRPLFLKRGPETADLSSVLLPLFVERSLAKRKNPTPKVTIHRAVPSEGKTIEALLQELPQALPDRAKEIVKALDLTGLDWSPPARSESDSILTMIRTFEAGFLILVPLTYRSGDRRIFKMTYESPIPKPPRPQIVRLKQPRKALGLRITQAGLGSSYHLEINAPSELWFHKPGMYCENASATPKRMDRYIPCEWFPLTLEKGEVLQNKIYGHARDAPQWEPVDFLSDLRVEAGGTASSAFWISLLTSVGLLLALVLRLRWHVQPSGAAGASLIAVLPSLYILLIFRKYDHRLVQLFTLRSRALLLCSSLISLLAAASLVISAPTGWVWIYYRSQETPFGSMVLGTWVFGWRVTIWMALLLLSLIITGMSARGARIGRRS
jgi:hypothetical protein